MYFDNRKNERALEWLKKKNVSGEQLDPDRLSRKDILAIILSAIMVFGPIFLILLAILWLTF